MKNAALPKLLRAMANSDRAKEEKHDIIFDLAAEMIERHAAALNAIANLPQGDAGFCREIANAALEGTGQK